MELLLYGVLGALANRVRGGLWKIPGGTQVGRLVWGASNGLISVVLGWGALLVALGAFVGCMVGQYGGLAMGQRGAQAKISPWLTMTFWGLARTVGPAGVLWWCGGAWWWLIGAGLLCAPIYRVVWLVPEKWLLPGFGYGAGAAEGYDPPELAEALHGAVMLVCLGVALHG